MPAPRETLITTGDHPTYPPNYPEKNKIPVNPLHTQINDLVRAGMPLMTAFKQVYRAAAAAPK